MEKHAAVPRPSGTTQKVPRERRAESGQDRGLGARLAALREAQERYEIRRELRAAGLL